ncbi:MAG TPA: hypothetical protein VNZ62_10850 [Capillimicrobium sp.]|nr:hypothetical protein [Capillimicrobium sp.]
MSVKDLADARWFAGKGRPIAAVREASAVSVPGGTGRLVLADVAFADGGAGERYLLDEGGPELWPRLVAALADGPVDGDGGRLELRRGPAFDALACGPDAAVTIPATDQSNTLVALDGRLLVKAYRRLAPGVHPEVGLCAALAATDAPVPAFAGSVHHVAPDGADTAIALLSELIPDAEAGWEAPILRAADALRRGDPDAGAGEHRAAGAAVAALHRALAQVAPVERADPATAIAWREDALAALAQAAAHEPEVARARDAIAARLGELSDAVGVPVQRIHGDLHVAQLLRTPGRVVVIDFEGDPTLPLARRRAPDTPLRDLAGLLRSVDHVGWAAARRVGPDADPGAWIAASRAAVLDGYATAVDARLLATLELAKACRELVYAHTVVPEWAYAPRAALRSLLEELEP